MKCHIVPEVYLKSWKIPECKNSIFIFDKQNIKTPIQSNISNLKNTYFVAEDIYILKTNNENYTEKLKDDFCILYNSLINYSISFNNTLITTLEDFLLYYSSIDNWIIHDKYNNPIECLEVQKSLEQLWDKNVAKLIENYFDSYLENRWNVFLDYINNELISKKTWIIKPKLKEYFLEFASIQFCRRYENLKGFGLDFAVNFFLQFLKDSLPKNVTENTENAEDYKKDLILIELYRYVKNINPNIISHTYDIINSDMQVCFLIAPPHIEFITSDNPFIYLSLSNQYPKYYSGMFLPINRNICTYICKNTGGSMLNKYLILSPSYANVKFINHLIKSHSINHVAYCMPSIDQLLSKYPDTEGWKEMLGDVGLVYTDDLQPSIDS